MGCKNKPGGKRRAKQVVGAETTFSFSLYPTLTKTEKMLCKEENLWTKIHLGFEKKGILGEIPFRMQTD